MSVIRSTSVALILSTSIVMGACSPKDKGPSAEKSAPAQALGLKGPSDKAFAKHFAVPKRKVSESEAKQALAELNLLEKSGESLSWAKSSGKAGNYSYSDLSVKDDDGSLSIKKAELIGVHMEGDVASFDRADFSGITIYDEEDDVTVTMDTLSVARPTPDMAKAILTGLQNIKDIDDLDLDIDDEDIGFGALGMSGLKISSDDVNLTTKALMWGEDEETKLSDFKIEDVKFKGTGEHDGNFTGSLESFSGTGLKVDAFGKLPKDARGPMGMLGNLNPLAKSYDTVKMRGLNFDSDAVSVSSKGFEGKASEKGGVTTMRQVSEPFIIKLKDAPKDRDARRAYDLIKSLDFDEMVFQSSQTTLLDANKDTVTVKDGLLTMKDGFKLSYNYGASGVQAMTEKLAELEGEPSQGQVKASLEDLKLKGFQMRLEDQSIVDRSMKLAAQIRGGTPESVKKELKVILALAPMMAGGLEGEMIGEMSQAFGDFIQDGGTLSIVMDPKTPVSASELANYKGSDMTLKELGFSAKAE